MHESQDNRIGWKFSKGKEELGFNGRLQEWLTLWRTMSRVYVDVLGHVLVLEGPEIDKKGRRKWVKNRQLEIEFIS